MRRGKTKAVTPEKALELARARMAERQPEEGLLLDDELAAALGAEPWETAEWRGDDAYAPVFDAVRRYNQRWLLRELVTDPKRTSALVFLLKQPEFGGYSDKDASPSAVRVVLTLRGAGEDPFG